MELCRSHFLSLKLFSLPSLYPDSVFLPSLLPDLGLIDLDLGLRVGEGLTFLSFLSLCTTLPLLWLLSPCGSPYLPSWSGLPGVHLRREALCLGRWLLGFSLVFYSSCGLLLDLSLLIPTQSYPDLSLSFLSNRFRSAIDPYSFPSAKTWFYDLCAALWSSNQNGVCLLARHLVMLQDSAFPLGSCLFNPLADFTTFSFQLVCLVEFMVEEDLRCGEGLSEVFIEFASRYL